MVGSTVEGRCLWAKKTLLERERLKMCSLCVFGWGEAGKREGLHCSIWTVRTEMKNSIATHPATGNAVTCSEMQNMNTVKLR